MFAVLMGVAAVEGFWPGGAGAGMALAFLALCAIGVPVLMAHLTEPIIRDIQRLEDDRARLLDLYGRARQDSLLDGLTGLGNHRAFQEELRRQLEHATRHKSPLSLLLIDVDDLKKVNDEHGHAVGDELLSAVGRIAMGALRRGDRAFRVGGDEFAVVLPNADIDTGLTVARRMLAGALNGGVQRHPIGRSRCRSASRPSPHRAPWATCSTARRRRPVLVQAPWPHERRGLRPGPPRRPRRRPLDRGPLGRARDDPGRDSLRPVYQPIFSLTTGEPIGYEGLIRPPDRRRSPMPSSLFAAAERADRTLELDMACLEVVAGGAQQLEPGCTSASTSRRARSSPTCSTRGADGPLPSPRLDPEQLVVELTEREEVEDLKRLRRNAAACRRHEVRLATDDVGAGNAGLRLLSEVHFDIIKVDLSLVQGGILTTRRRACCEPSGAVARWQRDDRRRGHRDGASSWRPCASWDSTPARATCWDGRPASAARRGSTSTR